MKQLPKIIVILGPTASGKTDLAVFLAKRFGGEIVNADSRTIYRGMNIGTAKPPFKFLPLKKGEREGVNRGPGYPTQPPLSKGRISGYFYKGIRHHLFDIVNPNKRFSAAEYKEVAVKTIRDIIFRGKVPFLVGGTGLYIDSVVKNLPLGETVPPNKKLRLQFERDLKANRAGALKKYYQKLLKLDPKIKIDKNNPRRIVRALEICLAGKKFSEQAGAGEPLFDAFEIGITAPREELYRRINLRVDKMVKSGLEKEVRKLLKKYKWTSPGMSGIGYREWSDYLKKKTSLSEVAENIKKDTRHFAKRQLTWWRRDKKIRWISGQKQSQRVVGRFLTE